MALNIVGRYNDKKLNFSYKCLTLIIDKGMQ